MAYALQLEFVVMDVSTFFILVKSVPCEIVEYGAGTGQAADGAVGGDGAGGAEIDSTGGGASLRLRGGLRPRISGRR